jgi:hypothetical protein
MFGTIADLIPSLPILSDLGKPEIGTVMLPIPIMYSEL